MFGDMQAQPVLTKEAPSIEEAVAALLAISENAQPQRWIEFPVSVLLFLSIQGDPESGSLYVLDRKTSTWYWVDFDNQQCSGYRK